MTAVVRLAEVIASGIVGPAFALPLADDDADDNDDDDDDDDDDDADDNHNDDDAVENCVNVCLFGTDMSILNSPINLKAKLTRKITRHRRM